MYNMLFSNEGKAVTKNLYHVKEYCSRRILTEFSKTNCKREGLETLLKRFGISENMKHRPKTSER